MAEDWFADVQRHVANADETVVKKIVTYLGIALRNRDSSLVSFSDPAEVDRVREKFLRKKLGLTNSDETLDQGLFAVRDLMKDDRTKNRVTVYYLLSDWFGKHDLFGGRPSAPGSFSFASLGGAAAAAGAAGLAGLGASGAASPTTDTPATPSPPKRTAAKPAASRTRQPAGSAPPALPPASAPTGSAVGQASAPVAAYSSPPRQSDAGTGLFGGRWRPAYAAAFGGGDAGSERSGALYGWLWLGLGILAMLLLARGCAATPDTPSAITDSGIATTTTDTAPVVAAPTDVAAPAAVVPEGSGVVAGEAGGRPMLTVYFDSGQSAVSNQLAAQAETLKAYLGANPGSKLAVSGYNDPSGNAALNAELSKNRAQGVAAALVAAGVPQSAIDLVKPSDTTGADITPEQARRVEVTIQ